MDIGCAILAGGRSLRMGRDKATAAFRGATLIRQVYDRVRDVFDDIVVVSSLHTAIEGVDAPVVRDMFPFQTPIVGVATALILSDKPRVFLVACDMPFVSAEAIRCVISETGDEEITIPRTGGFYQPLHAVYRRSCLPHLLRLLDVGNMRLTAVLSYVAIKPVEDRPCFYTEEGDLVFSNINTREDLARINTTGQG